ncbi:MAG: response regulator [Deltaproteobacteria bacterium]|jgi:putative two-component system response regulator|nr:response regulator [Deltaproteobacteria bacterium]
MLISFGHPEASSAESIFSVREIAVVDDEYSDLNIAEDACGEDYKTVGYSSVSALMNRMAKGHSPRIIFLDMDLPGVDGFEALRMFKNDPLARDIPVVAVTAKHDQTSALRALKMGAVDYVPRPFLPMLMRKRVELHLKLQGCQRTIQEQLAKLKVQNFKLANYRHSLNEAVNLKTGKMADLQTAILQTVSELATFPRGSSQTPRYSRELSVLLEAARDRGVCLEETGLGLDRDLILQSSRLHDVGKLVIEESILNKPAKLTAEEFETIKKHTTLGVHILDNVGPSTNMHHFLRLAKVFAGTHHERWDGAGYPNGLRGEDIPLAGRLMAIADVYDGLTNFRPWKAPFTHEEAVKVIVDGKGSHFDPFLVEVFSNVADEFRPSV